MSAKRLQLEDGCRHRPDCLVLAGPDHSPSDKVDVQGIYKLVSGLVR